MTRYEALQLAVSASPNTATPAEIVETAKTFATFVGEEAAPAPKARTAPKKEEPKTAPAPEVKPAAETTKPAAETTTAAAEADPFAFDGDTAAAAEPTYTRKDVLEALRAYSVAHTQADAVALLRRFAPDMGKLTDDKFADVIKATKA